MHKQGIVANDGSDFIATSIESTKRNKMLSTPCVFSDYQARPGGVAGYQYTHYFAPKIPIYLKIVKCVILNT